LFTVQNRQVDAAALRRKNTVGQFGLFDVLVPGQGPDPGQTLRGFGPHNRCLFPHFSVDAKGVSLGPGRRVDEIKVIEHGIHGIVCGHLLTRIDQNVVADKSHACFLKLVAVQALIDDATR